MRGTSTGGAVARAGVLGSVVPALLIVAKIPRFAWVNERVATRTRHHTTRNEWRPVSAQFVMHAVIATLLPCATRTVDLAAVLGTAALGGQLGTARLKADTHAHGQRLPLPRLPCALVMRAAWLLLLPC